MDVVPSDRELFENPSCELMLTSKCNLRCSYCIAHDLENNSMTKEIGLNAIDYFIFLSEGASILDFTFTGGEPLLNYDLFEKLITYAVEKTNIEGMGARIIVKTNGTLIDRSCINLFKKYKCLVFISIDGQQEIHDEYRKSQFSNGTYMDVIRNFKQLIDADIPCIASMTISPNSVGNLVSGVFSLIENGIFKINIAPAYGTVRWDNGTIASFSQSLLEIAKIIKKKKLSNPYLEIGPIYKYSEHIDNRLASCWGCNAGSSNIAILPNGDITGCSSLAMLVKKHPDLIIGNVMTGLNDKALRTIINRATADKSMRKSCRNCGVKLNCSGGCLAINYSCNDKAFIPPAIYCETIRTVRDALEIAWRD